MKWQNGQQAKLRGYLRIRLVTIDNKTVQRDDESLQRSLTGFLKHSFKFCCFFGRRKEHQQQQQRELSFD